VLQVTSAESGSPISVVPRCRYRLEEFVVNWFRHYGLGFHAGGWLALAVVILLALVPGIALLRLVNWLLTSERDKDESERDYWRIHRG